MRITLALTVLLISQVVAEDKDAQDATEAEVKSANTEAAQPAEEVNREAESYTVPVEVVSDAVTESEAVRKADEHKEEQERIERATTGDVDFDDYADLKLSEDEKLFSETEHVNNRRSNDENPKSAKEDAEVKTAESDKASEKKAEEDQAETKTVSEDDDVSKKGEEVEKKGSEVKRADDAAAEEKSAVKVKSADEDKIEDTEKAAKSDDVSSLVSESESDFKLSTRRMSNPLETLVETKARAGDKSRSQASFSDESSAIFGSGDFSKAAEPFRSSFDPERYPVLHLLSRSNGSARFSSLPTQLKRRLLDLLSIPRDSLGHLASQTLLPPLMSLPLQNKQNFFLRPATPLQPPMFEITTQNNFRPIPVPIPNIPPLQKNFLNSYEQKPFNNFNSYPFQPSQTSVSPLSNLPHFEEFFNKLPKPLEVRPQDNLQQFPNFFKPLQVTYSVPNYLRYTL